MNWTNERPTHPGWYVFKHAASWRAASWRLYLIRIDLGQLKSSQNPTWLYASGFPSISPHRDMTNGPLSGVHGKWFGPIPEPEGKS